MMSAIKKINIVDVIEATHHGESCCEETKCVHNMLWDCRSAGHASYMLTNVLTVMFIH